MVSKKNKLLDYYKITYSPSGDLANPLVVLAPYLFFFLCCFFLLASLFDEEIDLEEVSSLLAVTTLGKSPLFSRLALRAT